MSAMEHFLSVVPGEVIDGQYEIVRELGAGGMGRVWLVRETSSGRPYAFKTLSVHEHSDERLHRALKRFAFEAEALAKLHHRRVVGVRAFSAAEASPYIVMDYFEGGRPVLAWARAAGLDLRGWLKLGVMLFEGIDHIHGRDIIHRDISSGNVLVRGDADEPELKIIDFGIARDMQNPLGTRTGDLLGKLGSIDPAVLRGTAKWSTSSDIYSAGVLLYRGIVGKEPHAQLQPDDRDEDTLFFLNQYNEIIPPLSVRSDIPQRVADLLTRMLDSDPAARPRARQVRDELLLCAEEIPHEQQLPRRRDPTSRPAGSEARPHSARGEAGIEHSNEDRTRAGNIRWANIGDLHLIAIGLHEPSDGEWLEYLRLAAAQFVNQGRGDVFDVGLLFSERYAPSSKIRKLSPVVSAEILGKSARLVPTRYAVVTDSLAVRGALTAMGWTLSTLAAKAFALESVDAALSWLGEVNNFSQTEARETLRRLVRSVGYGSR
jgi:serine/threonine protein kinase